MDARFLRNVLLKGLILFLVINFLVAAMPPGVGKLSFYNVLLDGRLRFPFGENPEQSYNLSLFDPDAMFAAHIISGTPKQESEYRVLLIGDSATWGTLLRPEETLTGLLEDSGIVPCDGRTARFYNLGYPTVSLTKDLMVLDYAKRYEPDLILWSLTLESFPLDKQLSSPIVANNARRVDDLIIRYDLPLNQDDPALIRPGFWGQTLIGQRRALADLIRLQLYGVLWSATGIDQVYPTDYTRAVTDLEAGITFHGQTGPDLDETALGFEILQAGLIAAGDTPVLLVNEPILISAGENSDVRYNFLYPRWAYDDWRQRMQEKAAENGWNYTDLWDLIPAKEFTNSAIHITPAAEMLVAEQIKSILEGANLPMKRTLTIACLLYLLAACAAQIISTPEPAGATATSPAEETAPPTQTDQVEVTPSRENTAVPTPAPDDWMDLPVVPEGVSEQMREVYQRGLERGHEADRFSKFGDCQSVPSLFLGMFDDGIYQLGEEYAYLQPTIDHFAGSWSREGFAIKGGQNVAAVQTLYYTDPANCELTESPMVCEIRVYNPSIVLISFETWWAGKPVSREEDDQTSYEVRLRAVVDYVLSQDVVPILATKADNEEGENRINAAIARIAFDYQIPLWNFWAAADVLPGHGLSDGFHLTSAQNIFDDPVRMENAWPWRNLTALQTIDAVYHALNETP